MSERYAWSSDEELYGGEFDSIESAFADAEAEGYSRPWIGVTRPPAVEDCIDADLVIDHITCQDDWCGDYADADWPFATTEQRDELTEALQRVVGEWVDKHKLRPSFFVVENPRRYERVDGEIVPVGAGKGGA